MAPLIRLRTFLENLSLRKTIALALIIGLAVPVGVSTFITLTQSRAALMERLRSDHTRIVDVLASGLQTPLWEMRPDAGRPLLEVLMLDNRVTAISISSPLMPQFLAIEAPKPPLGEVLSLERPVLRDGEEIGRIRVDMDTGPMKTRLAAQWIPILLTGLLQFGTGIVIIFALLRYKVITPLQRLVGQSEALAAGDLDQPLEWRRSDELGALGHSFDRMRRSLRRLVADLEERNQELQERETALARQAAVLRTILDNMTDGITLVDKDLDLVAWNDRFIDIMAVSPELIRPGISIQELSKVDLARSDYEPCDREATLKALRESFQPGRSITIPYRMADGRQIAIRRRPMPGGGFVSTYTDVTEQVEARRKADETRLLLEAVMDAVPAMLHVKDRSLRYQMANRRFLECWGFEREQFLGRSSHELFPESMSRAVEARDRQVLETGKPLPFTEITYRSPMGPMIVWSTKGPPDRCRRQGHPYRHGGPGYQ
jgi:PAS domain S-box-containing protein